MSKKAKINPNSTFITTKILDKKVIAYIDTGATLCFGKQNILKHWEKLSTPVKICVADKSIHKIWFVGRNTEIIIEGIPFITPTVYQHDSGIDLVIGNNFLKLYQPFVQTNDTIKLQHPTKGTIETPIIKQYDLVQMLKRK